MPRPLGRSIQQVTAAATFAGLLCTPMPSLSASGGAVPATAAARQTAAPHKRANFKLESASVKAKKVADWVVDSADNRRLPFVIVDKSAAKVFVFKADGVLLQATSALLGLARGDESVPGIGDRELSKIRPEERTTPTGRFVAELGHNLGGESILWVDYDAAISLHRLRPGHPAAGRAQNLATATPEDNHVTFGCVDVPVKFYLNFVQPTFTGTNGIVYILSETRSLREVFASYYDVH